MHATLSQAENAWLTHMNRFGSSGYPVSKTGTLWVFNRAFGVGGTPLVYKTKREAVAAVEAYADILRDKAAGRLPPSDDAIGEVT